MCTFRKVVKSVEVKVDVQKGALGLEDYFDNRCVGFIRFAISYIVVM